MDDIDIRILRPVALPPRFFGAPQAPAVVNMGFCMALFCAMMALRLKINVSIIVMATFIAMFVGHILLVQLGGKDPHLSTLLRSLRFALRKPRGIGRARRKVYYP